MVSLSLLFLYVYFLYYHRHTIKQAKFHVVAILGMISQEVCTPCSEHTQFVENDVGQHQATECTRRCRFWLLGAMMETTVSQHCAIKKKRWIYDESKARGRGSAELLDEES